MLNFKDALRQMVRDMRSQKLRTMLTIFGIVWGTVAVTLLGAFGQGLHKQMIKNSAGLGDRIAIAWPSLTSIPFEGLGKGRRIRVREENIDAVRRDAVGVAAGAVAQLRARGADRCAEAADVGNLLAFGMNFHQRCARRHQAGAARTDAPPARACDEPVAAGQRYVRAGARPADGRARDRDHL